MSIRNELLERVLAAIINGGGEAISPAFQSESIDTIPVSVSSASPSYITGLSLDFSIGGIELVTSGPWAGTGALINNSGLTLDMIGSFDFYPDNSGASSRIDIWSEKSTDGITITESTLSARSVEVTSTTESTQTKSSRVTGWADGEMLRFAMYDSGGGTISLVSPSVLANGTETVRGPSFGWQLATIRAV